MALPASSDNRAYGNGEQILSRSRTPKFARRGLGLLVMALKHHWFLTPLGDYVIIPVLMFMHEHWDKILIAIAAFATGVWAG